MAAGADGGAGQPVVCSALMDEEPQLGTRMPPQEQLDHREVHIAEVRDGEDGSLSGGYPAGTARGPFLRGKVFQARRLDVQCEGPAQELPGTDDDPVKGVV